MRTVQEIIDTASKRFNPSNHTTGYLNRQDILDFLATLPDGADKRVEVLKFIDQCPFINAEAKFKFEQDLATYL